MPRSKRKIFNLVANFQTISERMPVIDHLREHPDDSRELANMVFSSDETISFNATSIMAVARKRGIDLSHAVPVFRAQLVISASPYAANTLIEIHDQDGRHDKIDYMLRSPLPLVMMGVRNDNPLVMDTEIRSRMNGFYNSRCGKPVASRMRDALEEFSAMKAMESNERLQVLDFLKDPNPLVASAAVGIIIGLNLRRPDRLNLHNPDILEALWANLDHDNFMVSESSARYLAEYYMNERQPGPLTSLFEHHNPQVRFMARYHSKESLETRSEFLVPILTTIPEDTDPVIRKLTDQLLGNYASSPGWRA